jgi:hypothetical protein
MLKWEFWDQFRQFAATASKQSASLRQSSVGNLFDMLMIDALQVCVFGGVHSTKQEATQIPSDTQPDGGPSLRRLAELVVW